MQPPEHGAQFYSSILFKQNRLDKQKDAFIPFISVIHHIPVKIHIVDMISDHIILSLCRVIQCSDFSAEQAMIFTMSDFMQNECTIHTVQSEPMLHKLCTEIIIYKVNEQRFKKKN